MTRRVVLQRLLCGVGLCVGLGAIRTPSPLVPCTLWVDWDGEAVMVQRRTEGGKTQLLGRWERRSITLAQVQDQIQQWYQVYRPTTIYVDRGYGEYLLENLRQTGLPVLGVFRQSSIKLVEKSLQLHV